jgi:phosphohistidine phosphatase
MAAFSRRAGIDIAQIRHSGKRRAAETAAILAQHLAPPEGSTPLAGLAPDDDAQPIADLLRCETQPLMLVGHRPFLERLTGLLLAGNPSRCLVQFQPGGIVCLEQDPETRSWSVAWAVTPALIPQQTGGSLPCP